MGVSLMWRPILEGKTLSDDLRRKIENRYQLPRIFHSGDLDYIQGLSDCGVEDAKKLRELIEKYEEVELSFG